MSYINSAIIESKIDTINTDLSNDTDGLGALKTDIGNLTVGYTLTNWYYSANLPGTSNYIPSSDKISTSITGNVADSCHIYYGAGERVRTGIGIEKGFMGATIFDGTNVRIRNTSANVMPLVIIGFTKS